MKYNIIFEENSLNDLNEGIFYYNKISLLLSDKFYNKFWQTIELIKENPFYYQNRYKEIKIAFIDKFPFGIHYIVDNQNIIILKILHTKRFFK